MWPRMSSASIAPVMDPRWCRACLMSMATRSEGTSPVRPDWTRVRESFALTKASKCLTLVTTRDAVEASRPWELESSSRRSDMPSPLDAEMLRVVDAHGMSRLFEARSLLFQTATIWISSERLSSEMAFVAEATVSEEESRR